MFRRSLIGARLSPAALLPGARCASTTSAPISFTLDQAGLTTDFYVPPRHPPSWFTHPRLRWKVLTRNIQMVGVNTWMAIKLRREVGREHFRPLEWKETALLLYKRTNESFVKRDLNALSRLTSRWVYTSLSQRVEKLPKDYVYGWKMAKLSSKPKVISLIPLQLPDQPTQFVQMVYRIESKQILSKAKVNTTEVNRIEREVCDYAAFIFDITKSPAEGRLIGSLFETPPNAPMPDPSIVPSARSDVINAMAQRGDIFRSPPKYVALKD